MINVVIGNLIALVASILMVYAGFLKKKDKILFTQIVQISLSVVSNIILGGITGAIINVVSCIRDILCYINKLGLKEKIVITVVSVILSLSFNNMGVIGLLPLISSVVFVWLMNTKDVIKFKYLIMFCMFMWFIYDLTIKSYTSAFFDIASVVANFITIIKLAKNKKVKE